MINKLALPEIRELIHENDETTLGEVLNTWLPVDLGGLVSELSTEEQVVVFRVLKPEIESKVFEYLDVPIQEKFLNALPDVEIGPIINEMSPDDRTALLEVLPRECRDRLMGLLDPEQRAIATTLLSYHEKTIGRLMTTEYVAVRKDWTVRHVLDYVRDHGKDRETLNVVYVIDDSRKLIDDLRIRELLLAPLDKLVSSIMDNRFVALTVTDDETSAVDVFRKYDRTALPVVDKNGVLVGIVTIDDVLDVAEEQATRELQQFGGLEALDEPYSTTPLLQMVRKRATWLVILFVGELLTATAMGFFEKEIEKMVVLALFIPLIISSGGNSGSQAATLIIRALALGEIKLRDWWRIMRREILSGVLLGCILGSLGFLRIFIWSLFTEMYGPHPILIALTVSLALVGIVLWGTLSGAMLPFILKRIGLDPATSSAPFVATLVDVTGLVIYFTVAIVVFRGVV